MNITTEIIVGIQRVGKTHITNQYLGAAQAPEKNLVIDTFNEYLHLPAIGPDAVADFVNGDSCNARIAIPENLTEKKKQAYFESAIDSASKHLVEGNLIVEDLAFIYGKEAKNFPRFVFDFFRWKAAKANTLNVAFNFTNFSRVPMWLLGRSVRFRMHKQTCGIIDECIEQLSYANFEENPLQKKSPILKNAQLFDVAIAIIDKASGPRDYCIVCLDRPKIEFYSDRQPLLITHLDTEQIA